MTSISINLLQLDALPHAHLKDPYIRATVLYVYEGIPRVRLVDDWDYETDLDISQCPPNKHFKHSQLLQEGNIVMISKPKLSRMCGREGGGVGIVVSSSDLDCSNIVVEVTEWTQDTRQRYVHQCRIKGNMRFQQQKYFESYSLYCAGLRHVMLLDPHPTRDQMQYLLEINAATSAGKVGGMPHNVKEHAERAIQLQPEVAKGWYWLGVAFMGLGQFDEAQRNLFKAKELAGSDGGFADVDVAIHKLEEERKKAHEKLVYEKMLKA
eukprot:PhF_6_TR13039/c0_g1_i1/m.20698